MASIVNPSNFTTSLKLKGWKNFKSWHISIYGLLAQNNLHRLFKTEFDPSTLTEQETAKAVGLIISTLDSEVVMKLSVDLLDKPKDILNFLRDAYGKSDANYLSLVISLYNLKLDSIDNIEGFLEKSKNLYNDINTMAKDDEKLSEKMFVSLILAKVKDKFRFIGDLELNPDPVINMTTIFAKMISESRSSINKPRSSDSNHSLNVLAVHHNKQRKLFCNYCKRNNHVIKDCFLRQKANQNRSSSSSSSSSTNPSSSNPPSTSSSSNNDRFKRVSSVTLSINSLSSNLQKDQWLFDSGADNHFCCNRRWFKQIWSIPPIQISQFNPTDIIVCNEYGKIDIFTGTGTLEIEAYYVPSGQNAISVTKLSQSGFNVSFTKSGLKITIDDDIVWSIENQIDGRFYTACAAKTKTNDWHTILGHTNFDKIKFLNKKYPFIYSNPYKCDVCIANKMTKPNFDKSKRNHALVPMHAVYADLCGPFPLSIHGQKYMLVIIDQYSRFSKVFFLNDKTAESVFKFIKYFIEFIERNTQFLIKKFVTDNGLEFCNQIINDYLFSKGIIHVTTTAYTPQTNGLVERKNRSLLDMARCLLNEI